MLKPFCTTVLENHEFTIIGRAFEDAGFNIDWREVGFGYSDMCGSFAKYHAIFFLKEDKDSVEVYDLIDSYKDMINGDQLNLFKKG